MSVLRLVEKGQSSPERWSFKDPEGVWVTSALIPGWGWGGAGRN